MFVVATHRKMLVDVTHYQWVLHTSSLGRLMYQPLDSDHVYVFRSTRAITRQDKMRNPDLLLAIISHRNVLVELDVVNCAGLHTHVLKRGVSMLVEQKLCSSATAFDIPARKALSANTRIATEHDSWTDHTICGGVAAMCAQMRAHNVNSQTLVVGWGRPMELVVVMMACWEMKVPYGVFNDEATATAAVRGTTQHFLRAFAWRSKTLQAFGKVQTTVPVPLPGAAYVKTTSGSTGTPKCVVISRRALRRVISHTERHVFSMDHDSVVGCAVHPNFDMFETQVHACQFAWTHGTRCKLILLEPPSTSERDAGDRLAWSFWKFGVTIFNTTPTVWRIATSKHKQLVLHSLKTLVLGGERFPVSFQPLPDSIKVWNGYGLTETTIVTTYMLLTCEQQRKIANWKNVPIGDLIPGVGELTVRDGVLHVSGMCVAMNLPNPLNTKDVVRRTERGLVIVGRSTTADVKVNGVRVNVARVSEELNVITQAPCIVLPNTSKTALYVVTESQEDADAAQVLLQSLPKGVFAECIAWLGPLPVREGTSKADVAAIQRGILERKRHRRNKRKIGGNAMQFAKEVLKIANEVLDVSLKTVDDNWSQLSSLDLTLLSGRLRKRFPTLQVSALQLLRHCTPKAVSALLTATKTVTPIMRWNWRMELLTSLKWLPVIDDDGAVVFAPPQQAR